MQPIVLPPKLVANEVSVTDAEQLLLAATQLLPEVTIQLREANGRVLREDIVADRPFPPFDRVTMDGIALSFAAWEKGQRHFEITDAQLAGQVAMTLASEDVCLEVMTGAVLPHGTDCVVPVEEIQICDGYATITKEAVVQCGQFIHYAGSDQKADAVLVHAGARLSPVEIAIAASVGKAKVRVSRLPSLAIISTGDELVDVETEPAPHQVRQSNLSALHAALSSLAHTEVTLKRVADELDAICLELERALQKADMVVITGGVSKGRKDFVPGALSAMGIQQIFHRVRQRPGRPMWAGQSPEGQFVFGLPGNPVSSLVTLYRYVLPMLRRASGELGKKELKAILDADVASKTENTRFVPVSVHCDKEAQLRALPVNLNTSGDMVALTKTDGFVQLDEGVNVYTKGATCRLWLWREPRGLIR